MEAQWDEGFDRLKAYVSKNKHCNIPARYESSDGFPLGYWLTTQGQFRKNGKLSAERIARLDALGVFWGLQDVLWEKGFSHLKMFLERVGHCRVPDGFKTDDGYRLGAWVGKQRSKKDTMEPDRRRRLESLAGWSWDPYSDQWEKGFCYLKEYSEVDGHCRVPYSYKTNDGYWLGGWVRKQRTKKDKMNADRRQRLEALPSWTWKIEK